MERNIYNFFKKVQLLCIYIYTNMFKKNLLRLSPSIAQEYLDHTGWSKECCVLVRDIIISILPIIWLMFIEIMLFQLGSHTSSYPKLMNKGREGRMEGATDSGAVGQYFPGVVMI